MHGLAVWRARVSEPTIWTIQVKIGCKVVHHARRMVFQLAEVAVSRQLFRAILQRIEWLRLLTPAPA